MVTEKIINQLMSIVKSSSANSIQTTQAKFPDNRIGQNSFCLWYE